MVWVEKTAKLVEKKRIHRCSETSPFRVISESSPSRLRAADPLRSARRLVLVRALPRRSSACASRAAPSSERGVAADPCKAAPPSRAGPRRRRAARAVAAKGTERLNLWPESVKPDLTSFSHFRGTMRCATAPSRPSPQARAPLLLIAAEPAAICTWSNRPNACPEDGPASAQVRLGPAEQHSSRAPDQVPACKRRALAAAAARRARGPTRARARGADSTARPGEVEPLI